MDFESNVTLYGLIKYTKEDKIEWDYVYSNRLLYYKGKYVISGKVFLIDIRVNEKDLLKSYISITIFVDKYTLRQCFYVSASKLNQNNFKLLLSEIKKRF